MYAQVVPDTKTGKETEIFTYKIPENLKAEIRVGQRVLIAFHNRKIEGVVVDFLKKPKTTKKLKKIEAILDPVPVIDDIHLKLAKFISSYYYCSLSQAVFTMVPAQPKRWKPSQPSHSALPTVHYSHPPMLICDRQLSRVKFYAQLAFKNFKVGKGSIIIFPEMKLSREVLKEFQSYFPISQICLWHSKLSKTEIFKNFQKIRAGKIKIVIGSRSAIFAPVVNLGLVILDQDFGDSFKQDQSPRYHVKTVAQVLSYLNGAKLVFGENFPTLENYYLAQKKKIDNRCQKYLFQKPKISILDLRQEKGPLCFFLETEIKQTLKNKGKIILFLARRGQASLAHCQDCEKEILCGKCNLPYTYHLSPTALLICHRCGGKKALPPTCPNCHSAKLKFLGYGTEAIENKVKKLFPNYKTLRLDKETTKENLSKIDQADIIIATSKIFEYPQIGADLTGVIFLDNVLNLPDFQSNEKAFNILFNLANTTKKKLILQTYQPENIIFKLVQEQNLKKFYQKELQNRLENGFPPFVKLIKLVFSHQDEQKCQRQAEKLFKKLQKFVICHLSFVILVGPSPAFHYKIRGKFRWQIIIKLLKRNFEIKQQLLKQVPEDWIIDVEPVSLL